MHIYRKLVLPIVLATFAVLATPVSSQVVDNSKTDFYEALKRHKGAYAKAEDSYRRQGANIGKRVAELGQVAVPLGQSEIDFLRKVSTYLSYAPAYECNRLLAEARHLEVSTEEFDQSESDKDAQETIYYMRKFVEGKYEQAVECIELEVKFLITLGEYLRQIEEKRGLRAGV